MSRGAALVFVLTASACAQSSPPDAGGLGALDATPEAQPDAAAPDAAHPDAEADAGVARPPDVCDELALARVPLQPGAPTHLFGDLAGDFTVRQLDGTTWTLAEGWTGCESYVFLTYLPTNGTFEDQLFDSPVAPLITDAPINAHFFFLSAEATEDLRRARASELQLRIEAELAQYDESTQSRQRARFHFVLDRAQDVPGSLGAFYLDYLGYASDPGSAVDLGDRGRAPPPLPFAVGIDRDQRWDDGGNLAQYVGGAPAFAMAGYLPHFYAYKAALRDAAAPAATYLLVDTSTTARTFLRRVDLPGPAIMAGFDTLEAEVRVVCAARNVFACSEWDRIGAIHLCADATCQDAQELFRWITPYWRRGEQRWVIDASPLLGLLKDGGPRSFRVALGPDWERPTEWEVQVHLRLDHRGTGFRGTGATRAFTGGDFGATYNTREPFRFTPPAGARRVELVLLLSGHGQAARTNCAEWCDHRHHFQINGTSLDEIRHLGVVGSIAGCGRGAARGVPPGQFGNWAPERAYWCPGMPLDPIRLDLTPYVVLGGENELRYSATTGPRGAPGGGNIELSAYVAWSE